MVSGVNSYVRYKRESGAYTTHSIAGDSTWKVFGHGLKVTTSAKNNNKTVYGIGSRLPTAVVPGPFEATVDLDFKLSNPWWLRLLIGQAATKTGAGPYSYYWLDTANENGVAAVTLPNDITPFTIENGINLATDSVRLFQGCFLKTASISASVDTPEVDCRLSCDVRTITKGTAGIASQETDTESVFNFVQGTLNLPNGTPLAGVQNFTMDFDNGTSMLRGLGSRFASGGTCAQMLMNLKASMYFVADADVLDYLLGSTTAPAAAGGTETTLTMTFDNGLATTLQRLISFKFTGVYVDDYSIEQAMENPLIDNWTPQPTLMTLVKALNNTSAEP